MNLKMLGSIAVEDIITCLSVPAHLKDIKSGKYLFSNQANLSIYQLQDIDQVIGRTIDDFNMFMQPCWGDSFANEVKQLEYSVTNDNRKVDDTRVIINLDGKIILQQMTKSPIHSIYSSNKVTGIFTFSQDKTSQIPLLKLYGIYKNYYPSKSTAVVKFLQHINCVSYFDQMPTESELRVLLVKVAAPTNKATANILKVAPKTVEIYSSKLMHKVKNGNLAQVLSVLRELKNY